MHIFHKWVPQSVFKYNLLYDDEIYRNKTEVLFVCSVCNKLKTQVLDGFWNLEDVKNRNV